MNWSILTFAVVCAVLLAAVAAPVSAAPTEATEREGEARTLPATPGGPDDRSEKRATDVTSEIIPDEGRDVTRPIISGTITITTTLPAAVPEENVNLPNGRQSIREIGRKK